MEANQFKKRGGMHELNFLDSVFTFKAEYNGLKFNFNYNNNIV